ncbi:PVC-type heme-binding CxxCH protein [Catalinimonas niigatensis]|nr:PVC-type heme-binding CxxCH protein [Catalinimonas niigatensis]WPP50778.1 PVC-type heme-binding CxxCH protein [Catalinimonas niigatensis]
MGIILQACIATSESPTQSNARRAEVLFLGHNSQHHDSNKYAPWLAIAMFKSGINLTYTTDLSDLNTDNLTKYDGLIIYANHDAIAPAQEEALKAFVEGGKGLIPLHSATGCFKNSDWYINTIGGQFASHGTGTFTAEIVNAEHPVMDGLSEFETWDETYVHQRINPDMTVLMERVEGDHKEPYTWVREQGNGRVFYTAYGHNDSTWTNAGFQKLVTNGVLWAIGDEVKEKIERLNIPEVDIYDSMPISDFTARHIVPKMQEALSPEESQKLIQVPADFEIQLFASEPDITNPIAMTWDERGRLWIVESVDYPNTFLETDGAANDRIKICEDTDGDGMADKFTVFADSLNIPTSMVFANDGVIVSMAPHFVFLKDTDGDDKADVRENIISGWGKNDTHAGPSNLQYGFDNKIWGVLGYSGFEGEIDGKSMAFRQGVYRFAPDGSKFEYLASSSNNTWGLGFSEENHVFVSTANNTHSAYYAMPTQHMLRTLPEPVAQANADQAAEYRSVNPLEKIDGHYDAHAMTPNLRQVDVVGGFTSAAGHHLYTARSFPKNYWNRIAFVNEPTIRLVHNAIIEPDGAGFKEKDGWNLMASSDEWFGPVHTQVGPDGAVWVADWYNFIIQHNVFVERQAPSRMVLPFTEQPHGQGNAFISSMRDLDYGRIYRVIYKNAQPYEPIELSKEDTEGLLEALQNDNMFWRMTAQRLLVESKNQEALSGLYEIAQNQEVDEIGLNSPAVHALWTLHGLGALDGKNEEAMKVAVDALSHPAAGVRKAAVSVLPKNAQTMSAIQDADLLQDENLNVRMETLLALADLPPSEALGKAIYQATLDTKNADDPWLNKALLAAAITHQEGYLSALSSSKKNDLSARIAESLKKEVYELPRRGPLPYPIDVRGKEIIIKASVAKRENKPEGVIMAHGGQKEGYGVYIQNGQLTMAVNQGGKMYKASSKQPLPDQFDLLAQLGENGQMSLSINGKQVAQAKAPSLFDAPFTSVIRTSSDFENEDKIGNYEGAFSMNAELQNVSLELRNPDGTQTLATNASAPEVSSASEAETIYIKMVPDMMKFDKEQITVRAGQKVVIELENQDGMQHNMLIIKPGTLEEVGAAADALARDPKAAQKAYVPDMPEVLHASKLLNPEEVFTLTFTAPSQPGDYPFVCTFPGHWRMMNGIMKVEEGKDLSE